MTGRPTITDEQLAAIKARAEAATPGPWEPTADLISTADPHVGSYWLWELGRDGDIHLAGAGNEDDPRPDLEFIAHAREDIPALIAEVERLRGEVRKATVQATLRLARPSSD